MLKNSSNILYDGTPRIMKKKQQTTSWGGVADWYSSYLETTEDSYQKQVILPNLLRILDSKSGMKVIDIACGQGFFSREFAAAGAEVVGADIAQALITQAKKLSGKTVQYYVAPADNLNFTKSGVFDAATIVLAIQNIKNIDGTFAEAKRVLKPGGKLVMVLMHPAFRIPGHSSWGFDEETKEQYRRVDSYLSAQKAELFVHPGKEGSAKTISYHRSLQDFSKSLCKAGFAITRLEEWISHKQSQKGPRQETEDRTRKEIPMFLMLECKST
ncbi:methyltransferase domain-containing protein [Patescibacteria group bacterium]|nr:methyltransferase domain-containing protein [Patescibacteria group bacterium]